MAEYLGVGDLDAANVDFEAIEREVQEAIAECMAAEGFEYVPAVMSMTGSEVDLDAIGTEEWVAEHGYGLSSIEEPVDEEALPEDPNAEYVESLSTGEQDAYYEALYGPVPSEDELLEDGSYEYDWAQSGCQGAADHEVRGDAIGGAAEFDALFAAIDELYQATQDDPRMVEVDGAWSECMAEAGHADLANPTAAFERAMGAIDELWAASDGAEPSDDALEAAHDDEVALALADLACKEATDHEQQQLAVQFALEEQFVEDHRAELDAYRASIEQGS